MAKVAEDRRFWRKTKMKALQLIQACELMNIEERREARREALDRFLEEFSDE